MDVAEGGPRPFHGPLLFALVVSAITWVVFGVLDVGHYEATEAMASIDEILDTSTMVVAAVVGALILLRWRLVGERRDIVLGLGLVILGVLAVGFDELVGPRLSVGLRDDTVVKLVPPLGFAFGLAVLALPVLPPPPRLRQRLQTAGVPIAMGLAVVALTAVAVTLVALPGVAEVIAGRREGVVPSVEQAIGQGVVAGIVFLLARRFWTDADPSDRPLYAWLALMLVGIGEARVGLVLTYVSGPLWLAASRILRFEGMLFALLGIQRDLQEGFVRQQSELRTSWARVRSMEAQRAAEREALEERRHDVRSALFAIGGVAELLNRSHDDLDTGTLEALTHALGAEVQRLQELVAEQEREDCGPFSLLDTVSPLVLMERSNGLEVTCDVGERLTASGRPKETAQVLRNLLDNARLYAPGSPVTLRAEERDEWVVLLVEDRGPGVPAAERKAVFDRARRGSTAEGTQGSGLGLYVASRLMHEQGGDLWVTDRPGGGASFVLSLPIHRPPASRPSRRRR